MVATVIIANEDLRKEVSITFHASIASSIAIVLLLVMIVPVVIMIVKDDCEIKTGLQDKRGNIEKEVPAEA